MRAILLLTFLVLSSTYSVAQKLSEEDALEGSGHLMNPDDEDFESSGLPPEDDDNYKPSSVKPHFVTEGGTEIKNVAQTEAPSTIVTRRPTTDTDYSSGINWTLLIAIGVIILILLVIFLIFCYCRKRKSQSEYTAGTRREKEYV
ncbi:hypothetical protein FO519_000661 [Halicephalobus sp. NKZ332]|nr:hypothetical protein FO519_000661 [Halicephalobus sp. NKZ332]